MGGRSVTHIDLYRAFGLDRMASPAELAGQLTDKLAATPPGNAVLHDQLHTARAILGDPGRRAAYDARLADPFAPVLDPQALSHLAASPGAVGAAPSAGASASVMGGKFAALASTKVLLAIAAVLAVAVAASVAAVVVSNKGDGAPQAAGPSSSAPASQQAGPSSAQQAPSQPSAPVAPIPGAFAGAGGPRPANAEPLPTYTRSGVKYAHILSPTGGIGCDFSTQNQYTRQGQCGVTSMNSKSSPLGTEKLGIDIKGKWLFQLSNNRVGDPVGNNGTTGWMNQPANDGYTVPRVQYGKQYYFENWVVAAEMNGLTVWNTVTGSGVFLSNEKAETFDGPGRGSDSSSGASDDSIVLGSMPPNGRGYGTAKPSEV